MENLVHGGGNIMFIYASMSAVQGNAFFTHNNLEVSEGLEYKLTNSLVRNLNHCPWVQVGNTPLLCK